MSTVEVQVEVVGGPLDGAVHTVRRVNGKLPTLMLMDTGIAGDTAPRLLFYCREKKRLRYRFARYATPEEVRASGVFSICTCGGFLVTRGKVLQCERCKCIVS